MNIKTHEKVSKLLVGTPIDVVGGVRASATLTTTSEMIADSSGLIHGGFTFGLADYAAMLAVNHPNVVLGSAQVKFIAPVRNGETMRANATVTETEEKKIGVNVEVNVEGRRVFTGIFVCYVLEKHVLDS
jgi:uncharacterized protein (TIGR00369 family)